MPSIGGPFLTCFPRAFPIFFIEDRGLFIGPFGLKRSNGRYAKTSHGKWFKFGTQTPRDMFHQPTEFHLPPPPGTPSTDGRTDGRTRSRERD